MIEGLASIKIAHQFHYESFNELHSFVDLFMVYKIISNTIQLSSCFIEKIAAVTPLDPSALIESVF